MPKLVMFLYTNKEVYEMEVKKEITICNTYQK